MDEKQLLPADTQLQPFWPLGEPLEQRPVDPVGLTGAGAVWAWKSKSQGDGRMTVTSAEPGKRLGYELYFPDFGTTSTGDFRLDANGGGTQVTWSMDGDMGSNPIYRWMGLFMNKMVGPDFDTGLANLKTLAEKT